MIIKKYAEATVDESIFFGKVEVETENKNEWENVIRILETAHSDDDCVCHCNMKENAELVAKILDCDVENKVFPCEKKMTNADHIRAMSDEELKRWLLQFVIDCAEKTTGEECEFEDGAEEELQEWLELPVEERQ